MAGLGRKVFTAGEVLTAANVQGYLADQAVMRFASSAARATAIGTATEGMVSYLDDINETQQFNGTSWEGLVTTANVGSLAPQGNAVINGGFDINQRQATSTTTSGGFVFDRWAASVVDGTTTYSAQSFALGAAPVSSLQAQNYARLVSSGQTLINALSSLLQSVEYVRSFADQTVTVSFWAKASSGTPKVTVWAQQDFGVGGSPSASVNVGTTKQTISTSWARYSFVLTLPSISGKTLGTVNDALKIRVVTSAGTDRASYTDSLGIQSGTFDIWGVQLEAGSVATPFKRNAPSVQAELAACQRYYYRILPNNSISSVFASGYQLTTTTSRIFVKNPVTLRSAPSSIEWSTSEISDSSTYNGTISSLVVDNSSTEITTLAAIHSTGGVAFRPAVLRTTGLGGYVGVSAEL